MKSYLYRFHGVFHAYGPVHAESALEARRKIRRMWELSPWAKNFECWEGELHKPTPEEYHVQYACE